MSVPLKTTVYNTSREDFVLVHKDYLRNLEENSTDIRENYGGCTQIYNNHSDTRQFKRKDNGKFNVYTDNKCSTYYKWPNGKQAFDVNSFDMMNWGSSPEASKYYINTSGDFESQNRTAGTRKAFGNCKINSNCSQVKLKDCSC